MNKIKLIARQYEALDNTTFATDIEPAISIDHVNRLGDGIKALAAALGITELTPVNEGASVKIYKTAVENTPEQVAEGDEIPLTKVTRKLDREIAMVLKKFRKLTTAEAIQRDGYENAVNKTDDKIIAAIRSDIKGTFFKTLDFAGDAGDPAEGGSTLQEALANIWAALQAKYEDIDVTPVYFVNPADVAKYLGTATVTTQEAFGVTYLTNFLGLGTVIISNQINQGEPIGTCSENLNCAYVPANGTLNTTLGLTSDETGLVAYGHSVDHARAGFGTLAMSGVLFYAEDQSGVFKGSIA